MAKDEIEPTGTSHALGYDGDSLDKKESRDIKDVSVQAAGDFYDVEGIHGVAAIEHDLNVTEKDALEAEEKMGKLSLDEVREIMQEVLLSHEHDQNFPATVIQRIRAFLDNEEVFTHPHLHSGLINEMKLEAILVTENSPYAEVRAVVDNTDNPDEPSSTIRAWLIGTIFVVAGAFINQLFSIRFPAIKVGANVAQLLAFPCGRLLAATLPDKRFRFFGQEMSLNPGPFNRKEHMMITIMANVGFNVPYTENIILTQYLKQFFNQAYATDFAYQILVGLGTNFVGFGLAGLARRFLVWPAYCVWPTSLVTIALNRAFHTEPNMPVAGPFGKTYTWSRMRLFFVLFAIMFVYFWFPGFIFPVLSTFNWISWISPDNQVLNNIVGSNNGLGINPLPTFDWNIVTGQLDPLVIPWFTTINCFLGMITAGFMIVGMYWTNAYNTGYLPINSNRVFDNMGKAFNVSRVIDSRGIFDDAKYQSYSMPWMAAGNLTIYFWFFAVYSATITYAVLFHRREIWMGLKNVVKRRREADKFEDVHMRLMRNYKEVPEWWFLIVLCVAMGCGMAGIGAWQTYTTPAVVIYGVVLAIFFVVPVGIIYAITGIQVTLNVLAEFIGGAWVAGNALAMNYFKAFGYITTAQALYFSNDLKLAHYVKIPPRVTFSAQIWAVLVSTFVCTGIFNFQMTKIPNVCTSAAPFGFSCPGVNTFFTAAVFWGTLGPHKLFGLNGQYKEMLIGFPVGFILVIAGYVAKRIAPRNTWVRMYHPVAFTTGALFWAPYNMTYVWPAVPIAFVTWMVIKPRYLAFWSKYNYIVSAAFASGVAIAGLVIFFGVQLPEVEFAWWGTDQISVGCEGTACRRLPLPAKGFFGPEKGNYVE